MVSRTMQSTSTPANFTPPGLPLICKWHIKSYALMSTFRVLHNGKVCKPLTGERRETQKGSGHAAIRILSPSAMRSRPPLARRFPLSTVPDAVQNGTSHHCAWPEVDIWRRSVRDVRQVADLIRKRRGLRAVSVTATEGSQCVQQLQAISGDEPILSIITRDFKSPRGNMDHTGLC